MNAIEAAALVESAISRGLISRAKPSPTAEKPRPVRDLAKERAQQAQRRARFTAQGLTAKGTPRVLTPRPELRGLPRNAYRVAFNRLRRAEKRAEK